MDPWGRSRAAELAELVEAAMPAEQLSHDELLACCWDDPDPALAPHDLGIVLGTSDGAAAVSAVIRGFSDGEGDRARDRDGEAGDGGAARVPGIGFVKLLAVHPDARREGNGRALLDTVEQWAWDNGALELHLSGSAPFYLWPGVDAHCTEMLCLAEAARFEVTGSELNMALPTTFRAAPPEGTTVRRVIDDADVRRVHDLVTPYWPYWIAETDRAIDHGCCHAAFDGDDRAIGFVCHSVNRAAWLGPMGTEPNLQHGGVGRSLLDAVCTDLMIAGYESTEISWVGPVRFYAKAGATVSRVFRSYRKRRP